ncbi:MAG: hypothetical protein MJZ37_00580 [Bacilli bacterium]|nr:hypothetical protein [Bacilli bacterium]
MQGKQIETLTLQELFSSSTEGTFPFLIDIQHDELVWSDQSFGQENGHFRLINSTTAVRHNGKKYLPAVFSCTLPSEDGQKIGNTSITVSAIDRRIIEMIRTINTNPRCVLEAYFAKISDTEFVFNKLNHYEFEMTSVNWDNQTAKWNLVFDPAMQLSVPVDLGTKTRCPAAVEGE